MTDSIFKIIEKLKKSKEDDYRIEHTVPTADDQFDGINILKKGMEILNKPFKSEAQRRYFHWAAKHGKGDITPAMVSEWEAHTGNKELPEKMDKGAMKRLAPFDPSKDIESGHRALLDNWVSDAEDRSLVPKLTGSARIRGLHHLSKNAITRKNPETGEREFLLFRGKTGHDMKNSDKLSGLTSFTPDPRVAKDFNDALVSRAHPRLLMESYPPHHELHQAAKNWLSEFKALQLDPTVEARANSFTAATDHFDKVKQSHFGGVYSSWVPESAIHHIPNAVGEVNQYKHNNPKGIGPNRHQDEQEVLINANHPGFKPVKLNADQTELSNDAYKDHISSLVNATIKRPKVAKSDDLEKAKINLQTGKLDPEHSDPEGMQHPDNPNYVKGRSVKTGKKAVWKHHPDIAANIDKDAANALPKLKQAMPEHAGTIDKMYNSIAKDGDRHVIDSGASLPEARMRHFAWAAQGKPGYSLKPTKSGFSLTAERHSKGNPSVKHTWNFDGNRFKFSHSEPISNSSGGAGNEKPKDSFVVKPYGKSEVGSGTSVSQVPRQQPGNGFGVHGVDSRKVGDVRIAVASRLAKSIRQALEKNVVQPKWRMPSDEELSNEHDWEYRHVKRSLGDIFPDKNAFIQAAKRSKIVPMPDGVERATDIPDIDGVKDMVSEYQYPRDVDRIVSGLKDSNTQLPVPIVVRHNGRNFMMGGNTRQNLARIHGMQPHVLMIDTAMKKSEDLEKGVNGDWKNEGYKLQHKTLKGGTQVIIARLGNKIVGRLGYYQHPDSKDGYHQVFHGFIDKDHQGKGMYQSMLHHALNTVLSQGSKGIKSEGFQRSQMSERAWKKMNPEIRPGSAGAGKVEDLYLDSRHLTKPDDLMKGQSGDWQKEGYKISHSFDKHGLLQVTANNQKGEPVGYAEYWDDMPQHKGNPYVGLVEVEPEHRRKGLASAMHAHAEKVTGKKVIPSVAQSKDAKALWSQPNKPFGKSSLQKGQAGDWQKEGYIINHKITKPKDYPKDESLLSVQSYHPKKIGSIGFANFLVNHTNKTVKPLEVGIEDEHQRKGLGSAMYVHAEKVTGHKMIESDDASEDAEAMWTQPNRPFGKSDELEKGQAGDWKKEGYKVSIDHNDTFTHHNGNTEYTVKAHSPSGEQVGMYSFWHKGPHLKVDISDTKPDHQRKGLASEAYRLIQHYLGSELEPSRDQSSDAQALWAQPNRPFGKADELEKGKKGDWQKEGYELHYEFHEDHPEFGPDIHEAWVTHNNKVVGRTIAGSGEVGFEPRGTEVSPKHRRKGIATAMYNLLEQKAGEKLEQPGHQSKAAMALWDSPARSFGKADAIPGGLADDKTNKDFPAKKIKQGEKVELEHTSSKRIADEIARDHLTEDPAYYTKLAQMEKANQSKIVQSPIDTKKTKVSDKIADKTINVGKQAVGGNTLSNINNSEPGWSDYNTDVYHGLDHTVSTQKHPGSFTPKLVFAAPQGLKNTKAILKGALTEAELPKDVSPKELSHFLNPTFTTAHREAIFHKLANNFFGLGKYTPRTTVFRNPTDNQPWSAMEFVHGAKPVTDPENELKNESDNGDLHKLAIMDVILGNNDRHAGNIIKDHIGNLKMIDHGLAFDYNHITTDVRPKYAEHLEHLPVPQHVDDWLWSLDSVKLANMMHASGAHHDAIMAATSRLADARGWSNLLRHGHKLYGKDVMANADRSLHHLYDIMNAVHYSIPTEQKYTIQRDTDKKILAGKRRQPNKEDMVGTGTLKMPGTVKVGGTK